MCVCACVCVCVWCSMSLTLPTSQVPLISLVGTYVTEHANTSFTYSLPLSLSHTHTVYLCLSPSVCSPSVLWCCHEGGCRVHVGRCESPECLDVIAAWDSVCNVQWVAHFFTYVFISMPSYEQPLVCMCIVSMCTSVPAISAWPFPSWTPPSACDVGPHNESQSASIIWASPPMRYAY